MLCGDISPGSSAHGVTVNSYTRLMSEGFCRVEDCGQWGSVPASWCSRAKLQTVEDVLARSGAKGVVKAT